MKDALVLERRREALKIAARLQRRNVSIRWQTLRGKRSVQWIESSLAATRTLHDATGLTAARRRRRSRTWLWLASALRAASHTRGDLLGTALSVLRRPSLWSLGMLVGRWWWRRRSRSRQQRQRAVRARMAVGMR